MPGLDHAIEADGIVDLQAPPPPALYCPARPFADSGLLYTSPVHGSKHQVGGSRFGFVLYLVMRRVLGFTCIVSLKFTGR